MPYSIGIDLGTSNSVACVWRRGQPQCIPVEGRVILPSAISFRPDGTVLIGSTAKQRAMIEPESSIMSAKRFMGDDKTQWEIFGRSYTPVDVSAVILRRLKEAAEAFLKQPVTDAVITVPAYFNNKRKLDTKLAGEQAGFNVLQLLPEPTAAAISYGLDKGKDQTLLVYDLGGGTFDVSILKVKGNQFDVVAIGGDAHLGGDDFDLLLAEHLVGLLKKAPSSAVLKSVLEVLRHKPGDPRPEASQPIRLACQKLKEVAERAKIELSESDSAQVALPNILGTQLDAELKAATYDRLIGGLIGKTIDAVYQTLSAAHLKPSDIDRVILVGGSTRNRLVKTQLAKAVKDPYTSEWVDEAVARGAAIVAASLSTPELDSTPVEIVFHNVTPFNLGVRAAKGRDTDLFEVLIPQNTRVGDGCGADREFTTHKANQKSVEIAVFQGNGTHCSQNTFIGKFRLSGIPPAPAAEPRIFVKFKMDRSDLLSVSATCSDQHTEQTLEVNVTSREDDRPEEAPRADIIFLVDTSGSMSAELEGVKKSGMAFAQRVADAGVDCRLGLVDFALPIFKSKYALEVFPPMVPNDFPRAISGLSIGRLGFGGCYIGDANTVPVIEAFVRSFPDDTRLKIGILVSDEVSSGAEAAEDIARVLQNANVCLHVFGVKNSCHKKLASASGGKFWDIVASRGHVDFSELLDDVANEITNLALR